MVSFIQIIEELIQATKVSKTIFAMELGLSPSSLSKLLSGSRQMNTEDFYQFRDASSAFFAQQIFEKRLQNDLQSVFPVLYDFLSEEELNVFLKDALTYFYLKKAHNREFSSNHSNGIVWTGKLRILHMACCALSERLRIETAREIHYYCSLWLPSLFYEPVFERLKIHNPHGHRIVLHQLFTAKMVQEDGFFAFLQSFERHLGYCDLRLYTTDLELPQPFIFCPDESLLLFNPISKLSPIVGYVDDLFYLAINRNSYLAFFENGLSYNAEQMLNLFKSLPKAALQKAFDDMELFVSFLPLGILIDQDRLDELIPDEDLRQHYKLAFDALYRASDRFCLSYADTEKILSDGRIYLPLLGCYQLDSQARAHYLSNYRQHILEAHAPMKLLYMKNSSVSALS